MQAILYVVFFLSGATGLVYEVIWVRLTGLVFGNTSLAISTVLGAFMDLAHQYYLGYYISRRPGTHHIRVEIPDRDLKIRAKTGYVSE